jgi:hypothetical protein
VFAGRRFILIGAIGVVVWYVCVLALWALQPLSDSVPVGVDYTLKTPVNVSVSVDCNSLFNSAPRDDSPLPELKAQPAGDPSLEHQREPCVLVQDHARIVFVLDTAVFALAMAGFAWFVMRRRRSASSSHVGTDTSLVGVLPS